MVIDYAQEHFWGDQSQERQLISPEKLECCNRISPTSNQAINSFKSGFANGNSLEFNNAALEI